MKHVSRALAPLRAAALITLPLALGGDAFGAGDETHAARAARAPEAASPGGPVVGEPLATEPAAASSALRLSLPAPSGPYAVGVQDTFLEDPTRTESATGGSRTLPIRLWYPACKAPTHPPARYASELLQPVMEEALGLPIGSLDIDVHARVDAPPQGDFRGVILVSAGHQEPAAFQTAHAVDLASRGWAVVAIDHPHDTLVVEQPGHSLIFGEETSAEAFEPRVADVGVVLDALPELLPGWQESTPVGMFGHSLGGSAAAEALLRFPRLQAAVDLDGSARGQVLEAGLDKPFGAMLSTIRELDGIDDGFADWYSRLRGPHSLVQLDLYHDAFSDFVVFNPEASAFDPALGALLESQLRTDAPSVEAGEDSLARQRRFMAGFFARHLRKEP
jgi:pimeloyl-ACP methyl ester carboxylesterase